MAPNNQAYHAAAADLILADDHITQLKHTIFCIGRNSRDAEVAALKAENERLQNALLYVEGLRICSRKIGENS